jgi:DNA polymerase I
MGGSREDEWLWGWDPTPGIVSVWAELDGRATVWRRTADGSLVREQARFRPWCLLASLADLSHLGPRLRSEEKAGGRGFAFTELQGPGTLRFLVSADEGRALTEAVLSGAARRLGRRPARLRDLGAASVLVLPPEEQYLVASGRTYFRGLVFDHVRRAHFDLETTGIDPERERIFLAALRGPDGHVDLFEAAEASEEPGLIHALLARIREVDPDVIENHNLHGFDLPFLARRAELHGVPVELGRSGGPGLRQRAAARGVHASDGQSRFRYTVPGRELIDTLDAVWRHDFSARDLPGHGLKEVARHFGLASPTREYVPGAQVAAVYQRDPERVRRYLRDDVEEAAGLGRLLGGSAFALAQMAPRRYERLADAGAATGVIDPLLVRAYVRSGAALPVHQEGDGTVHTGAALYLFASGVARNIVKADVASLYPSLMRQYRIGPSRDRLGAMLALVDRLVEQRLAAKARAKAAPAGASTRHADEALSAAMKLIINSAYGYLGASGLTRFSDVHAANEVTRHGRETLDLICRELAARGVILLEADTDGVYFAVPDGWTEEDERRVVSEVAALLPPLVHLEYDGRYAAMLSHEPKNYVLQPYDGPLKFRGVAFRSSRAEPLGEAFLRRAATALLTGDVEGVRRAWVAAVQALRRREVPTFEVTSLLRLRKTAEQYRETREERQELSYEAMLASGRHQWTVGERVRVYRAEGGRPVLWVEDGPDARDYDREHYVRLLRNSFATRLARALTAEDFATLFGDPIQPSLFDTELSRVRTVLNILPARPV